VQIHLALPGVRFASQHFDDLNVTGLWNDDGLKLHLTGSRLGGAVFVPPRAALWSGTPMRLTLTRLNLLRVTAPEGFPLDPRALPPLEVQCDDFTYGDATLGTATLSATPGPQGLHFNTLRFDAPNLTLEAQGEWRPDGTEIQATVKGPSLQGLLTNFGYESTAIEGGATEIGLDAYWPGGPAQFKLERMQGQMRIDVKQGRLFNMEPREGRIFALMSLQMLPRRLFLDFSDLFSKGFSFDRITGTYEIEGGNAYTNGLVMRGPAAKIVVMGRTGLAEGVYDQTATVTPQLSGTIPMAGALFGPSALGAGAALITGQKSLGSLPERIDSLLSRQYTISGPLNDPVVAPVAAPPSDNGGAENQHQAP
jgi:uncharacterized protein YhdP